MNTTQMETYEQWKEAKLQKIWNLYSHIDEDKRIDSMSPEHRLEFLDDSERMREISTLSTSYKGKIKTDSSLYDVKKVNKDIKHINKKKKSSMTQEREKYILSSLKSYGDKIRSCYVEKEKAPIRMPNYNEAIEVFGKMFLEKSFHDSDFVVDDFNRNAIKKLLMYFIRDPDVQNTKKVIGGPLDLNKGIYLFGDVGSGKSNLMFQLHLFLKQFRFDSRFEFNDFDQTNNLCQSKGIQYLEKFKKRDWCHDELIPKDLNNFGNKIEPAQSIVFQSYNRYIATGRVTHFTGNATPQELAKSLGMVAYSRLSHMNNYIFMGQINRRPNNH